MITIRDRVRFGETDLMGVVHHANYFHWLELGRIAYLRAAGVDINTLMEDGYTVPLSDAHCKYLCSARFNDEYEVRTTMTELTRVKMNWAYEVVRCSDGKVLARAESQNVFTDLTGKITKINDEVFAKINAVYSQESKK